MVFNYPKALSEVKDDEEYVELLEEALFIYHDLLNDCIDLMDFDGADQIYWDFLDYPLKGVRGRVEKRGYEL